MYTPFDDWSYLRFLLPAIALMLVLASAVTVSRRDERSASVGRLQSGFSRTAIVHRRHRGLALFCVRVADDRLVFNLRHCSSSGFAARVLSFVDRVAGGAVVLSVWDSGAVRFHGRKEALSWEGLDPAWLDRSLEWLGEHGHAPFIMLESWEEPEFRKRFGGHSDIGKLDWPAKYEIDRLVRIFDPGTASGTSAASGSILNICGRFAADPACASRARRHPLAVRADDAGRGNRPDGVRAGRSDSFARPGTGSHSPPPGPGLPRGRSRARLRIARRRRGLSVRIRLRGAARVEPSPSARTFADACLRAEGARDGSPSRRSASGRARAPSRAQARHKCLGRILEGHHAGARRPALSRPRTDCPPGGGHQNLQTVFTSRASSRERIRG